MLWNIFAAAASIALGIPAFWLAGRYNMHMFQLNVYMNGEQRTWLRRNRRLQWILTFSMLLGVLRLLLIIPSGYPARSAAAILDVLILITLAVMLPVYRLMKEMNTKKKLVFTARVKRMLVTETAAALIASAAVFALCSLYRAGTAYAAGSTASVGFIIRGLESVSGIAAFVTGSQLWLDMLANTINRPVERAVNRYYINDARRILKSNPRLTVIGVTGSYGKTSVKFFLGTLLSQRFSTLVTPESYNTPMGVVKTIRGSMKPTHEIFVCEMGARYVGEIKEICDIVDPRHGIITSIGPQHLDTFGGMDNIRRTKFELADALPEDGMLFLNGDNIHIREELDKHSLRTDDVSFYHSERIGEGYYASDINLSELGTSFTVTAPGGESERFTMKLIGSYNIINVMGAIAVAHRLGIPLSELRIPVRRLRPVRHRMEMKENGNVTIIDDAFNSNPVGSKAAVETLAMFSGVRILITPGMVELGEDEAKYNRLFGTYAADCCDWIFLVGRKHTEPIMEGIMSKGFSADRTMVFDKVEDAISYAYSIRTDEHKYILLENDLPDNY